MLFAGRAHSDRLAWASMPKLLPWKNCDVFREAPRISAAAYPKRPACFRLTEPPAPRLWLEHAIALTSNAPELKNARRLRQSPISCGAMLPFVLLLLGQAATRPAPTVTLIQTPHEGIQPQCAVDPKGVLHLIY